MKKTPATKWIPATRKPKTDRKFGDSDYYLCVNMENNNIPFVAWYSRKMDQWTVAHQYATSNAAKVTHYSKLPPSPDA